jgi:predicted nucleotidyltransferase
MSVQFAPRVAAGVNLDELVDALLRADADILEIVLFGSAAYAPDLARDIDLLILTRHKKEMDTYWDEIFALDLTLDVDTLLKEPGEIWNEHIALSVAAVGISLYGNHLTFEEAQKNMGVPTFEEARKLIIDADDNSRYAARRTGFNSANAA